MVVICDRRQLDAQIYATVRRVCERRHSVGRASSVADLATATRIADTTTDVILRLRLKHGRAVEDYSCFPDTQEVVASARARFVVASAPRVEGGYTYVDLVEESREAF